MAQFDPEWVAQFAQELVAQFGRNTHQTPMKVVIASFYLFLRRSRLNPKGLTPIHFRMNWDGKIMMISTGSI